MEKMQDVSDSDDDSSDEESSNTRTIASTLDETLLFAGDEEVQKELTTFLNEHNKTPLHLAAETGATEVIGVLMKYIPEDCVNWVDANNATALHIALQKSHNSACLELLKSKALQVNAKVENDKGGSVLHIASRCSEDVIKMLIDSKVDLLETNVVGSLAHHEMARHGNAVGLRVLLEADVSAVNSKGHKDGYTALHWAAREGHVECVKVLLAKRADCDIQSSNGNTPMHVCISHYVEKSKQAAERDRSKSIKYHKQFTACILELINGGANLEFPSREGRSALAALCRIEPEFTNNKFGGEEAFKAMLKKGAKVNTKSQKGYQPIHYAADAGNWALVKLLIEQDVKEINALGSDGFTALGYVEKKLKVRGARTKNGNKHALLEKTAKVLLEKGAIRRAHADVPIEENTKDILYMRNNLDGTYQMKAANVSTMISRLTHRVFYSPSDVYAFLHQYHKFTTPKEILGILRERFFPVGYSGGSEGQIDRSLLGERRSVLCLIEAWLSKDPECFWKGEEE